MYKCIIWSNSSHAREYDVSTKSATSPAGSCPVPSGRRRTAANTTAAQSNRIFLSPRRKSWGFFMPSRAAYPGGVFHCMPCFAF